uniref:A-kinase anchoring protein 6 n=1 Tax=Leptobrachium leishanense TaxID=445787 RepID=A0A8C5MRA8_9ANUR
MSQAQTTRMEDMELMDSQSSHECDIEPPTEQDCARRQYDRPPPLHAGADWKIILHLPEIDTWIRGTSERVRGLTQSVQEDPQSKHVDVHLMQLKEICEDISDHVEQIHALLDTEFSLKLLSYSVNVIVDIHTVQLLWHQLRVSVLVLRERILQGLQDSNGNYTRQTDILQAFTKEDQEDRLDALTEVDGSGQLTIRCPSDYLSLDCGITAYELSDYSPRDEEEPQSVSAKPLEAWTYKAMQQEFPDLVKGPGLLSVVSEKEKEQEPMTVEQDNEHSSPEMEESGQHPLRSLSLSESATPKRPLQETSDHGGDSPTRPSLPKRGLFLHEDDNWENSSSTRTSVTMTSPLPTQPSYTYAPYDHLTLSLTPPCSLKTHKTKSLTEKDGAQDMPLSEKLDRVAPLCINGNGSPCGSSPSPCSSPKDSLTVIQDHRSLDSPPQEIGTNSWYGSDEFLALPSHLHQADLFAQHLDNLSQLVSPSPEESLPGLRDVEDWEISSGSEIGPSSPRCFSPNTPSDLTLHLSGSGRSTPCHMEPSSIMRLSRSSLIQRLLWDIQRQDNDRHVWERIQGFVSKLDRFIRWLQDAMEATENWTPPLPETEALQQYLHTHLNFKQSVDAHCALKDAVLEEGHRLMEVLVSHRPGFVEMLQMITTQWKELQKQIRRQHGWILSSLDAIKTEILKDDENVEEVAEIKLDGSPSSKDAQRDAVSQMSLQLSKVQYYPNSPDACTPKSPKCSLRNDRMQDMEAECEEFWDWLLDMEATVKNSLGLLVSEDQHLQMCKRCNVEMLLREDRVRAFLGQLASMKHEGAPACIVEKEGLIREKWEMLKKSLSEALSTCSPQPVLSPGSGNLVQQLDQRVKELKSWLRDTELTLYNSSLRVDEEGGGETKERLQRELQRFQALCSELQLRRRGVASVLHLCHHLLSLQDQTPQQDPPSLQLLSVNLERRWEAIVMQSTQWQRRLQRELGEGQEIYFLVDPDWADLSSARSEEALEWDETDITVEADCDSQDSKPVVPETVTAEQNGHSLPADPTNLSRFQSSVYQVYSLHNIELIGTNTDPSMRKLPNQGTLAPLPLSLLHGSNFSSLPDLANGSQTSHYRSSKILLSSSGHNSESESGIASGGEGVTAANSEGCLSLDGDGAQSGQEQAEDFGQIDINARLAQYSRLKTHSPLTLYDCSMLQTDKLKQLALGKSQMSIPSFYFSRTPGQVGTNRTMLPTSSEDYSPEDNVDLIEVLSPQSSPHNSSSLESISAACEGLETEPLRRSVSLESWPASYKSNEDLFSQQGSADITPGSEHGEELSKRTLDLLKRLEDIECPSEQKMKRSLSDDITLRSGPHEIILPEIRSPAEKTVLENEDLGSELTELSSSEELSLQSEDIVVLKGRLLDSNASFRKHLSRSLAGEDGEANLSMIVNVSCTSACTDEEDDSDLLSSSTLTLTEEEEEEEELEELNVSMGSEDEAEDGTGLPLGSDFIRRELQAWIRPSILLPRERRKLCRVVQDIAGAPKPDKIWKSSLESGEERNGNESVAKKGNITKSLFKSGEEDHLYNSSHQMDDLENGNLNSRVCKIKDTRSTENHNKEKKKNGPYPWMSITKTEKLHPPSMPALAYHKPRELGPTCNQKSNLRVTCDAIADVDMTDSCCKESEKTQTESYSRVSEGAPVLSCSCHNSTNERSNNPDCTVHEFVKEILDMTSTALHGSTPNDGPSYATGAQIREKVLEHSRRQLERGDFYSYLSLSSHDSDCGEVNESARARTPQMSAQDYADDEIESMFKACTNDKEEEQEEQKQEEQTRSSKESPTPQLSTGMSFKATTSIFKRPQSRAQNSGQQSTEGASVHKFQGRSEVNKNRCNPKVTSKVSPLTQEKCSDPREKHSTKPTASSLPLLHKRVQDQRSITANGSSQVRSHQKTLSHEPKT